jgi:hypothetical protein
MKANYNLIHSHLKRVLRQKIIIRIILFFLIPGFQLNAVAQSEKYTQLWNEFQFSRPVGGKWSTEIDIGSSFSNTPTENRLLNTNTQRTVRGWAHYQFSPRWKLSSFLAYYYNKDVPDIGQYKSNEWRFALQGIYYFHKIGYTFSTRMRGEFRYIQNQAGNYNDYSRYRQQVKYLKPINSQLLRKGVFYALTSDELFLRSNVKSKGINFFDRNRFAAGGGYLVTDDFQIELTYVNEYMPRDNGNQIVNAMSLTVSFNNLMEKLKKKFGSKAEPAGQSD